MPQTYIPSISVIVTFFNAESTLTDSLMSLRNQDFEDFEVILVNDGSEDSSAQIAEKFVEEDQRFRLYSIPNSGVAAARNLGVSHSRGKYIIHHDADDTRPADAFSRLWAPVSNNQSDIVIGTYKLIHSPQQTKLVQNQKVKDPLILAQMLLDESVHAGLWNKLIKREFYAGLNIPIDIRYMEDKYLLINILLRKPILTFTESVVYHYHVHSASLSHRLSPAFLKSNRLLLDQLYLDARASKIDLDFRLAKAKYKMRCFIKGEYRKAREHFSELNCQILGLKGLSTKWRFLLWINSLFRGKR